MVVSKNSYESTHLDFLSPWDHEEIFSLRKDPCQGDLGSGCIVGCSDILEAARQSIDFEEVIWGVSIMTSKGLVAAARNSSTHFGIVLLKSVAPSSSADFCASSVSLVSRDVV